MARRHKATWEPGEDDYYQVFLEQNPWFEQREVPGELAKKVERPLAKGLWKTLQRDRPKRFQLVLGPRRVGKSTVLYQTVRALIQNGVEWNRLWWARFDHPLLMETNPLDLVRFACRCAVATPKRPVYLFLDELAYARKWDLCLKSFYDERWPVKIAGSSSSTAALKDRRLESGVGRWEEQYLAPYLFGEFLELLGRRHPLPIGETFADSIELCIRGSFHAPGVAELRQKFLLTGGFPELLLHQFDEDRDDASILLESQRTLRSDAVERAVYKDIPQAFGVENPMMLERVLYALAGQLTGVLSPKSICQNLGLTQPTFDRYLTYLERAFLVFTLQNYSGREVSRQKRGRKLYFVDGAVRNAALQRGLGPLNDPTEMGYLLENLVAGHLHALSQQTQVRLYHWRDGNDEIDLIYDHPEKPLGFEVSNSPSHARHGLRAFMERFPRFKGRCYLAAPNVPATLPEQNGDRVGTLPVDTLLLAASAHAERELLARLGMTSAVEDA